MGIQTIYIDDDYEITSLIFTNGNIKYSLQHLCSIKLEKVERYFPLVLFSISLIFTIGGFFLDDEFYAYLAIVGLIGVVGSLLIYFLRKPTHKLVLVFSSGEKEVLENTDYKYLEVIAEAFSTSIKK